MGLYFNPGNESFKRAVNSPIYVDKSMLLQYLNTCLNSEGNCLALSHARRFGKSQAAGMIDAFYSKGSDSRALFEQLEFARTEGWDKHLNKFNVIHLDMSTFAGNHKEDLVEYTLARIIEDLREEYPQLSYTTDLADILSKVHKASDCQFVIIIDEWDCVIRNQSDRQDLVHRYMQFLHDIFKSEESKSFLALGYITGIFPLVSVQDELAPNNFWEYTMLDSGKIAKYFGFTEDEVKELCIQYGMGYESIKTWYNGYMISGRHMFNPGSVCSALTSRKLDSFWKNTSTFSTINRLINLDIDGLKDDIMVLLAGKKIDIGTDTFMNDLSEINSKDDALTALIHLGYLAYDARRKQAFIPNYEVATAFHSAIKTGKWREVAKAIAGPCPGVEI